MRSLSDDPQSVSPDLMEVMRPTAFSRLSAGLLVPAAIVALLAGCATKNVDLAHEAFDLSLIHI